MANLYHWNDPARPENAEPWHFVYLHGAAEDHMAEMARRGCWEWQAPDLVNGDEPMPSEEGDYRANLYGKQVVVVVRYVRGRNFLSGRAVLDDPSSAGYEHAFKPDDWR